jgi:hypothetical protein
VVCVPSFALPGELAGFSDILQRCQMTADVNKTDGAGQTPLHKAAEKCPDKCIMTLLNKSADIEARNTLGATPAATRSIRPFNQPLLDAQELTALRSDLDLMRAPDARASVRVRVLACRGDTVALCSVCAQPVGS